MKKRLTLIYENTEFTVDAHHLRINRIADGTGPDQITITIDGTCVNPPIVAAIPTKKKKAKRV